MTFIIFVNKYGIFIQLFQLILFENFAYNNSLCFTVYLQMWLFLFIIESGQG